MAKDDTKPTEDEVVEDQTPQLAEPSKEPEQEESKEEPQEPAEEIEEEAQQEPPEEKPSRREQLRVTQLLKRYPDLDPQAPSQTKPESLDYNQAFEADPEVIKQLETERQALGYAQYQAGVESTRAEIRTSEWRTLLNIDAPQIEAKYAWLNTKDKENFDPAMADALAEEYYNVVGLDKNTGMVSRPGIRWSEFVEARVELSTRLAKAMTEDTAKNVAKQSAQTGLRPDGSSAKRLNLNQAPEDMSIDELYAKIGQTPPKK